MLGILYRVVLALNATSWMIVVYGVKDGWNIMGNRLIMAILLIAIPIVLSALSVFLSRWFKLSDDKLTTCAEIQLADNEFLPVYLGYFFVALSIPDVYTLAFIYLMLLVFSYLSQTQYFNPIFMLLGYHYYHVKTSRKTSVFIFSQGRVLRSPEDVTFEKLRRINDTTFMACKEI